MRSIQSAIHGFIAWHRQYWLYWLILGVGMVAILVYEARDVGLEVSQWFWLIAITLSVAILCIWIITWGDDDDEEENGLLGDR